MKYAENIMESEIDKPGGDPKAGVSWELMTVIRQREIGFLWHMLRRNELWMPVRHG